jgi:hypothetical protein
MHFSNKRRHLREVPHYGAQINEDKTSVAPFHS